MTSDEIREMKPSDISTNSWLRELCLQVAVMNERETPSVEVPAIDPERIKRPYNRKAF
jgi:hypothetical protein